MFLCKNVPLFGHCHMSIDFRNVDGAVSQHFLNVADVHIGFQETGGKSMAEHVGSNMLVNRSKRSIFVDNSPDGLV